MVILASIAKNAAHALMSTLSLASGAPTRMGIREIEVFRAVMTAGSMSKAAGLLGISQPAVSQAIAKLESTAGLRLFERVRGRLVPTRESIALLSDIDRYFVGFEMIEHRIRSLRSYGLGRLAIAAIPAFGFGLLPRAIAAFDAEKSKVQISLQIMTSHEVYQKVAAGQVDFGLLAEGMSMSGLEHAAFAHLPAVVVMHSRHALARKTTIDMTDLAGAPFIALNPDDPTRKAMEVAMADAGVSVKPLIETQNSHTICELALAQVGFGIANPLVAADFIDRGLVVRPLAGKVFYSSVIAFRPGTPLSENARRLMRQMRMQLSKEMDALSERIQALEHPGESRRMVRRAG
jgi:DNA-binding transcriptional LysR family regulator